ncbi:DNA mismatch repair endonuclease MutL [bacterium]|jgi:DNA mismatch repair protein MutL|nr:DNA mismatch repair endonuclease MutL [bacterium]MBT5734385.1 DNA mismatch repair endonuclease MutL [bacterium]MBT6018490.1 DNA mismatch repair endonuclease MutL [bacterium]
MNISRLSEDLQNKISAGEVVERPSSVVKELLENSLDAKSNQIDITIEQGGNQLIQVRDNGIGIKKDQLPNSIKRFHTSKLSKLDDLFNIKTLGFRGEALASIASVAQLSIISDDGNSGGAEISVIDGQASGIKPAPSISGTQITIQNLFYNTPARRKFLKTPRTEGRKIIEMVKRFGLSNPQVGFSLVVDGKKVVSLLIETLPERIGSLFDNTYQKNIIPIEISKADFTFTGYIGNLNLVRKRFGEQYIYLNGRYIKDRLLNSAVYSSYQSLVQRGEYPFFIINIQMPYEQVDVNVHPMKTEVRFNDEWRVYHVLKSGVSQSLSEILNTIPNFQRISSDSSSFFQNTNNQSSIDFNSTIQGNGLVSNLEKTDRAKLYASNIDASKDGIDNFNIEKMWQVHKKYIISELNSGLVVIDQHVAHERVLYEECLQAFESKIMSSQTLLFPEEIEFSKEEYDILLEIFPYLKKIGFKIVETENSKLVVEATPSDISWGDEKKIIKEIIDEFISTRKKYSSYKEALAASFACKAAVKAGDQMSKDEMVMLVNRLFSTEHPYYCPHGRPIIMQLSLDELDRRFERI